MRRGRRIGTLACVTALLGGAGCAVAPVLEVPYGDTMCAGVLAGGTEPHWFGVEVSNPGSRPVELKDVHLGEQDDIVLDDAFAIPTVQQGDGSTLGVGIMHDPATESPDLWAARQAVAGYMIPEDTTVFLALALSRDAAETGRARSQIITYRVDGDFFDRKATSQVELVVTDNCQDLERDA